MLQASRHALAVGSIPQWRVALLRMVCKVCSPSYVRPMWLVLLLCVWPSATDQVGTDHAACVLLVALVQQVFGRTIQLLVLWQLLVRKGLCRSHARGKGLQWLSTVQAAIASILCLLSNSCRLLSVHLQMGRCLKCHVADKLLV